MALMSFLSLYFMLVVFLQNGGVWGAQTGQHAPPPPAPVGCQIEHLDPFSDEIMDHVHDYDDFNCPSLGVDILVDGRDIRFKATGKDGVGSVEFQPISSDGSLGGSIDAFNEVERIDKGKSGAIQCVLTKVCFIPVTYDRRNPPSEIEVQFTSKKCKSKEAQFTFTSDGLIRHKLTKKCFAPLGGWKSGRISDNTVLALSNDCSSKFNILHGGVLELVGGKKCIHPLYGGDPSDGKKACLYTTCTAQSRLSYRWYVKEKPAPVHDKHIPSQPVKFEMSHVKVNLINDEVMPTYIDFYALSVIPKKINKPATVSAKKPNVVVICIEEASVQNFQRKMELTEATMTTMKFLKFKKHASNSQTAAENMMNLILGQSEKKDGGIENSIFKVAKANRYVTLFSAEDPASVSGVGSGLADVDHNALPFFSVLKKKHQLGCGGSMCYCLTGNPIYNITLNYLRSFMNSYPKQPKLAVTLFSEVCRKFYDNLAYIGYIDRSMAALLEYMRTMKNTIIIVTSLRGGTTNALKSLPQAQQEVKRPFLAVYVSKDLRKKKSLEASRAEQLSTILDVHTTLRNTLSNSKVTHDQGVSLLTKAPARDCKKAGVDLKVCPCSRQGS